MFEDISERLTELASNSGSEEMMSIASHAGEKLTEDHKRNIAVVADAYAKRTIARLVEDVTGIKVPMDILPEGSAPVLISFKYAENAAPPTVEECVEGEYAYTIVSFTGGAEVLKESDISTWCGVDLKVIKENSLEDTDYLFLLTNATMALPMYELDWLRETVAKVFGCDRTAIAVYNLDLLNTDEDVEAVMEGLASRTAKVSGDIRILGDAAQLAGEVTAVASIPELGEKRGRSILRNAVDAMEKYVDGQLVMGGIDLEKLRAGVEKIERERKNIELSGKVTVENTVENLYERLRYEIVNAAGEYNNELVENITRKLNASGDPAADAERVPEYLKSAWHTFERRADKRISDRNEEISLELSGQIEQDCRSLLRLIEIPELEKVISERLDTSLSVPTGGTKSEKEERTKLNDKLIKGGVYAVSFILALSHPVLGIGAMIAESTSGFVSKRLFGVGGKTDDKERLTALIREVERTCGEIKKQVVNSVNESIGNVSGEAKENVGRVYIQVIGTLVKEIESTAKKVESVKARQEELGALARNISEIRSSL